MTPAGRSPAPGIQRVVLLAVASVTGLAVLLVLVASWMIARQHAWQEVEQYTRIEALKLAVIAEKPLLVGPSVVREYISSQATDVQIQYVAVIDADDKVIASTENAHVGLHVGRALGGVPLFPLYRSMTEGDTFVTSEPLKVGAITLPFTQAAREGEIRSLKNGAIFLVVDAEPSLQRAFRYVLGLLAAYLATLLAILFGVYLVLRRWVIGPMRQVHQALQDRKTDGLMRLLQRPAAGEIREMTVAILDAYEQLRSSVTKARASEDRLRVLLETAPDAIVTVDTSGHIQTINRAGLELFGYTADELSGQPLHRLLTSDMATRHDALMKQFMASPHRQAQIMASGRLVHGKRKDGQLLHLQIRIAAAPTGDSDRPYIFTAVIRDVAEQVALERKLREYNDTLEEEVSRRTEELQVQKERAESAALAKSQFLANMSHEIRTPMNAIIGMTHLVMNTPLNHAQRDYLDKIRASSRHLLGIINDILDFSKIESGKLVLERIEFDLEELINEAVDLVAERAQQKKLELIVDIDTDVAPRFVGDPQRVRQILLNYLNNAVKFTDQGQIEIKVKLVSPGHRGHQILRFEVVDTGIGLTASQQKRLFQEFEQADNSTTRQYGGTGLGLAISKRLAELMRGNVGVKSEYGSGATFWFSAEFQMAEFKRLPLDLPSELHGKRVLVVDDNAATRLHLQQKLTALRFEVDEVSSGFLAIEAVRNRAREGRPYDLILMDWRMPKLDGVDCARAIRENKDVPTPRILCVTAGSPRELHEHTPSREFDGVLTKPVTSRQLHRSLLALFNRQQMEAFNPDKSLTGLAHELVTYAQARVLLVEDNELNQQVARELLNQLGFQVTVAGNGEQALFQLERSRFDVVFMDMQMPVMDGLTATQRIRSQERWNELPIIAMTANAADTDRQRCLDAGMNDFIAKPIEPHVLSQVLQRWLASHQPVSAATTEAGATTLPEPGAAFSLTVDGLNAADGLRRCGGKRDFYLSMLQQFAQDWGHTDEKVRDLMVQERWADAARLAHTLKGLAGSLGAERVQRAALALEKTCQALSDAASNAEGTTRAEALNGERQAAMDALILLQGHISRLVFGLAQALPRDEQAAPAPDDGEAIDLDRLKQQLVSLLNDGDSKARSLSMAHAGTLAKALRGRYADYERAVQNFDFDTALELLN